MPRSWAKAQTWELPPGAFSWALDRCSRLQPSIGFKTSFNSHIHLKTKFFRKQIKPQATKAGHGTRASFALRTLLICTKTAVCLRALTQTMPSHQSSVARLDHESSVLVAAVALSAGSACFVPVQRALAAVCASTTC